MELKMSAKILFISFLALTKSAYVTSLRIREDYCELYCGTCRNRTCSVSNNILTTDDYTIKVVFLLLKFTWTNPVFQQWNICELSNETDFQLVRVDVSGIPSADDVRFRPGKFYLEKLGVKGTTGFDVESPSLKVEEREVTYENGPQNLTLRYLSESSVNSKATSDYIRASENNLKEIVFVSPDPSKQLTVQIGDLTFEGKTQLTVLTFAGLNVENLNAKTFDETPSLERLILNYVTLQDLSFSESKVLRQTLKQIIIKIADSVDMRYFGRFSRLETIEVDSYIPFRNLTAFICGTGGWICEFQFGTNGIPCPSRCSCLYYRYESKFEIDCSQRYLYRVPPLPVPIAGETALFLQGTYLTQLPEISLAGYNNVKRLNVSHNELSSLSISQLPTDLEELDISYNQISTLDPEVVEFIGNLNLFRQSGNKWTFYCGEPNLVQKYIRIKAEQLHSIMEMLTVSKGVILEKDLFYLSSDNLYYEADEDFLLTSLGNASMYLNLKILEELHRGIYLYSGEYEPIILRHLNAPCPYRCWCCLERESGQFIIDCRYMYLDFYPILPNFIPYDTTILLDGNEIARLSEPPFPNMPGLASIQKLHISNNGLTEFPHHLIPENVTYMDLRNNSLKTLDDVFVDFLRYREGILEVELSGNPWECDCTAKSFLSFLRAKEPGEYVAALNRSGALSGECPDACICCLESASSKDLSFIIDCSRKGLRQIPPLPTLKNAQTTLYFEGNSLQELPPTSLPGFFSVSRLHLAHNQLKNITKLPENLTYLDVRGNGISVLSKDIRESFEKRMISSQLELFLSGNPWTCSCEQLDFLEFVKGQAKYIGDTSSVDCADSGQPLIEVEESDICPSAFIYYASLAASLLVVASSINVFICFRQPILIWFYEHEICLSLAARRDLDQDKRYDAFLAFTHKDEDLVEEFVERLEKSKHRFRLCFYLRDWLVGESIPECISQSVKDSRRIIILMTNNFLKSTWGRLEFRLALHATSKDRCKRLIVVLYPEVENFDDLDSELRTYMVLNTYLERNNPNFWNKLIYSMPHS